MVGETSVVVVDSEQGVVNDITCSLRLINIPVHAVQTPGDAVQAARTLQPCVVLARMKIGNDLKAAESIATTFANDNDLKKTPVILLCTENERAHIDESMQLFSGQLALPVEFPSFTYSVQELLASLETLQTTGAVAPANESPPVEIEAEEEQDAPVSESYAGSDDVTQKLIMVYRIHLEVLERLCNANSLDKVDIENVPRLLADLTNKICAEFGLKQ